MERFGSNGVPLDEIDEFQLQLELTGRNIETCIMSLVWLVSGLGLSFYFMSTIDDDGLAAIAASMGFMGIIPALVHYRNVAVEQGRLPPRILADRMHKHVNSFGALVSLVLLSIILVVIVTGHKFQPILLNEGWGLATILILVVVLATMISASKIASVSTVFHRVSGTGFFAKLLDATGLLLGTIDSWLVLIVAPTVGAAQRTALWRYFLIWANLLSAISFSWFGPTPFGLAGTIWALLVVVSVVRRWAWIEKDRQDAIIESESSVKSWRVGSREDLRDESIWVILLLVIALPLGMRQVHMLEPIAFTVPDGLVNDPAAWLGFFGVELLRAIPFIDWSDIYGAKNDTRILAEGQVGMHAVFLARVMVDLVFIAAIVQAVSISATIARQKREFLNGHPKVRQLDERIERSEIARLAYKTKSGWAFRPVINKYTHYDEIRLSRLRLGARSNERLRVALDKIIELAGYEFEPPQELLIEVARDSKIDAKQLRRSLSAIEDLEPQDMELSFLESARTLLNWKGQIDSERQRLARIIIDRVSPTARKVDVLSDMLAGKGVRRDSLASVRSLALTSLQKLISRFPEAKNAIIQAARHDRAPSIRNRARSILKRANVNWRTQNIQREAA